MAGMPDIANFARALTASGALNNTTNPITVTIASGVLPAYVNGCTVVLHDGTAYPDPADDPDREVAEITGLSGSDVTLARADAKAHAGVCTILRPWMAEDVEAIWAAMLSNPMTTQNDHLIGGVDGAVTRQTQAQWDAAVQAAGNLVLIAETIVGVGGAASVTFDSIPGTYRNLELVVQACNEGANGGDYLRLRINDDSTSGHYRHQMLMWSGNAQPPTNQYGFASDTDTTLLIGHTSGDNSPDYASGQNRITIPNYARTTFNKTVGCEGGMESDASVGTLYRYVVTGVWKSRSAITKLVFTTSGGNDFVEGSTFTLYGVR